MTLVTEPEHSTAPETPEALIPEARQHQRRRYLVTGAVLLAAIGTVSGLALTSSQTHLSSPPRTSASAGRALANGGSHGPILLEGAGALTVEPDGDLLIADAEDNQILSRTPTGVLRVFAGNGRPGFSGDGGPAVAAQLHDADQIVVDKDGTAYFNDAGNCRIRSINAQGIIRTVAKICGTGFALAPGGGFYVADDVFVKRVLPNGTVTTVAGDAAHVVGWPAFGQQPSPIAPSKVRFSPFGLVMDSAGDLLVWSDEPEGIYRIAPDHAVWAVGQNQASADTPGGDAFAETPNGSVLFTERCGLGLITGNRITQVKVTTGGLGALATAAEMQHGCIHPDGVAVAPNGDVFIDTNAGDGWNDATGLAVVEPGGQARVLLVGVGVRHAKATS